MKTKDFERSLFQLLDTCLAMPVSASEMDQRNRALKGAGLLPLGGRGPHAPELEPYHVANILKGWAATTKPADAAQGVTQISALVPTDQRFDSLSRTQTVL